MFVFLLGQPLLIWPGLKQAKHKCFNANAVTRSSTGRAPSVAQEAVA